MKKLFLKTAVGAVVIVMNCHASMNPDFKLSIPDVAQIAMEKFKISLYRRDTEQLYDIAGHNPLIAYTVDLITEMYRAHMWRVRNERNSTKSQAKMAHYENVDYGELVYSVLPTELARCLCNIKGGKFEYTNNYNDILYYRDAENLDEIPRFMFESIVLANIFNRIKNKPTTRVVTAAYEMLYAITEKKATVKKYAETMQESFPDKMKEMREKVLEIGEAIRLQGLIDDLVSLRRRVNKISTELAATENASLAATENASPTVEKDLPVQFEYLPGKIVLRYRLKTEHNEEYAPLIPDSIEIINGEYKSNNIVIEYDGIEKRIIEQKILPMDNGLVRKLMTIKVNYANSLYNKLKENKYDLRTSLTKGYERDYRLCTLLNSIGKYTSVSLTGIPDIRDEVGNEVEDCYECIKNELSELQSRREEKEELYKLLSRGEEIEELHKLQSMSTEKWYQIEERENKSNKMKNQISRNLQKLVNVICEYAPDTIGTRYSDYINGTIERRIKALQGQVVELQKKKDKLLPKIPKRQTKGKGKGITDARPNLLDVTEYLADKKEIEEIKNKIKGTRELINKTEELRKIMAKEIEEAYQLHEEYRYEFSYKYIDDWLKNTESIQ
ncbi:MAG: hypothetical protein IJS10_01530 [Alphaproteobacteria bacterium]|nr:hypothetical protein [Alphaproteobacteria bacterium]